MKMKKVLAVLLSAAMVVGLAACGSKEAAAPAAPAEEKKEEAAAPVADAEEHEDVELEVYIVQTDWSDAWDEMEERFEAAYPWIDVISVGVGEQGGTFIPTRVAANNLPAVTQIDNNDMWRGLVDEGLVLDCASTAAAANIPASYKDAFSYGGITMGLTQGSAFSTLYINMDILNEAGIEAAPTNFDELIAACEAVQANTDAAAITVAGDKTTTCWMVYELILANEAGRELGFGNYEEAFKDGTLDFAAYAEATEKLDKISKYMMTGTSANTEDDVTAAFADGAVAMAIAGNWTAATICDAIAECAGNEEAAVAILPPMNDAGEDAWISVSPETAFGLTKQDDPAVAEAALVFYEWLFQPENFMLIQNARGTVPVLSTMTDDQIKLPAAIAAIVGDMGKAQYVKMGFNLWDSEFKDSACTALKDVYAGNAKADATVAAMVETLKAHHVN